MKNILFQRNINTNAQRHIPWNSHKILPNGQNKNEGFFADRRNKQEYYFYGKCHLSGFQSRYLNLKEALGLSRVLESIGVE